MGFKYDNKYAAPVIGGPINAVNRTGSTWSGRVNVTSVAANLISVAATTVDTTDLIFLQSMQFGIETVQLGQWAVRSINPGVGFVIGPQTSVAVMVGSGSVAFLVVKAP